MNTSFDHKFREKTIISTTKTNVYLSSMSSTAEALALSPAAAKRISINSSNLSLSARNSQILNANQLIAAVQNNAQKLGKKKFLLTVTYSEVLITCFKMCR